MLQMKPIYKTEIRVTDVENKFMVMGRGGEEIIWETGIGILCLHCYM